MSSAKKLAAFVYVNGSLYGPDDDVPADVAEQITNPKAWGDVASAEEDSQPESPEPKKKAAPAKKSAAKKAASSSGSNSGN